MGRLAKRLLVWAFVAGSTSAGCSGPAPTGDSIQAINCSTTGVPSLVTADTAFATSFFVPAVASGGATPVNAVVSPYSVSTAMMMADVGAAGQTDTQIETALSLPANASAEATAYAGLACALETDGSSDGNSLFLADALWGQQDVSFEPTFLNVLSQGYGAPLQTVDFAGNPSGAESTINAWVSQKTQGNITSLLGSSDVSPQTKLVLVNAIYFKGIWADGFDATMTAPRQFTLSDGSTTMVPTMTSTVNLSQSWSSKLLVAELPYKGYALAMDIFMPQGASGSLASFESTLTPDALDTALASLNAPTPTITYFPKFSFTTRIELANVLEGMGISNAFSAGQADFSGMDGAMDLSIGAVVQQALIEVDETGTVAAAATAVSACDDCNAVEEPPTVTIDQPFLFLIRDRRNGAILFMGHVANPAE
jgi:serpin B